LLVAPAIWFLLYALVWLTEFVAQQAAIVSGYSHNDSWTSMNDIYHAESWQLEYLGEDWAFYLVLLAPLLGWFILKKLHSPDINQELPWQTRHFKLLGAFVWLSMFFVACDTGYRKEYEDKATLPAVGSRA
jgi:hypothetical protein